MYNNDSKGISFTAGFFMLIAFAVAGLVLASMLSIPVWEQMTGISIKDMEKHSSNPANADAMRIMQAMMAVLGFFVPAVVTAALLNRRPLNLLGFSRKMKASQAGLVLLIVFAALIVSTSLSYFNNHIPIPDAWRIKFDKIEDDYNRQVEAIVGLKNTKDYILALVIMAFLPALCEETLFRGGLQNFLSRATMKPWLSIVLVSILFSLAHFSFYGFLYRFFLGVVLGALYHYSGKLWLSILAHFLNNAFALSVLYYYTLQGKTIREAMKTDEPGFWGILVLPVVVGLFIVFKRISWGNRRIV
jgi:membrane protease YdiL (CAAX protease family)